MSRDKLLRTLRTMGSEIPSASCALLRWAHSMGVDVRVLSDCNSVFIAHMLAGAGMSPYVREVTMGNGNFGECSLGQSHFHLPCLGMGQP